MASSTAWTAGGVCRRPVGEGRLGGDQRVELFEFDNVGPVGDDPVPPLLLFADSCDEMLVNVCGVDVAGGETFDEFAVVCGSRADQCLEFGASMVHLGCRQARAGGQWFVPAVGQPHPISQRPQHQLLPSLGRLRVEWLLPESGCCGVDLVDGSVMCDPSDGVVPHGGSRPVGWSVAEPVREPLRRFSSQPVSRTLARNVGGALEANGVARLDTVGSERRCPFT